MRYDALPHAHSIRGSDVSRRRHYRGKRDNQGGSPSLSTRLTRKRLLEIVGAGAGLVALTSNLGCGAKHVPWLRLRRTEKGCPRPAERSGTERADDPRRGRAAGVVQLTPKPGQERDRFQSAVLQGAPGAHLVGGACTSRSKPRRIRDPRRLLPRDNTGPGRQRLQGRHARVPHYPREHRAAHDLRSSAHGPFLGRRYRGRYCMEGIIQEIDIETGEVLLEWHSLD